MKVLKRGKRAEPVTLKVTCGTCDSELEAEEEDIGYDEIGESFYAICAVCQSRLYIRQDLPLPAMDRIRRRPQKPIKKNATRLEADEPCGK